MKSVYSQIYEIIKKNEERYEKDSKEYLAINLYCNMHLNHYKDWVKGTSEFAMDIANDALSELLCTIQVLDCLGIICPSDGNRLREIIYAEKDRLHEKRMNA